MKPERKTLAYFPTRAQELLLKASLLGNDKAIEAWKEWRAKVDLEKIDQGSARLLPLLAQNLSRLHIKNAQTGILNGTRRKAFFANRILFHKSALVLQALHDAGIETMLLKGAALISIGVYDFSTRPMNDFDILVPPHESLRSAGILNSAGWASTYPSIEKATKYKHAVEFANPTGNKIDLHWRVFSSANSLEAETAFWKAANSDQSLFLKTMTLNATDQLLHLCVHGARWNTLPSVRWVADTYKVIIAGKERIDWERLASFAEKFRVSLPLLDTLDYLRRVFEAPIPEGCILALAQIPVNKSLFKMYRVSSQPNPAFDNIISYWHNFLRSRDERWVSNLLGFPEYLKLAWKKRSVWQVYLHLLNWLYQSAVSRIKSIIQDIPLVNRIYSTFKAGRGQKTSLR